MRTYVYAMGVFCLLAVVAASVLSWPQPSEAFSTNHDYPRIVAWQLNANKTPVSELAKYDVVILDMNAQNTNPDLHSRLRQLNPNIVILAYTSPIEYPKDARLSQIEPSGRGLWHDLGVGLQNEWYLKTWQGELFSIWEGNFVLNLDRRAANGRTYAQHLGDFLTDRVLATGKWDGILFDTVHDGISGFNENIDINGDARKDSREFIDQRWRAGMTALLQRLRDRNGNRYLIITNGDGRYSELNNGRMFESFPEFYEGGWTGSVQRYFDTERAGRTPRFNIVNTDTDNTGNFQDYDAMRYGLTSTLLANGYFNHDYGTSDRSFTPYYDEYEVSLGRPSGASYNVLEPTAAATNTGLWRRDFERGLTLVNSSNQTRTYTLPGNYEKLRGRQDPYVNNGSTVNRVTIPPLDGLVLLRALQEVIGGVYSNGAYARVFSNDGRVARSAFFAFDQRFTGSQYIAKADLDKDGRIETLAADASSITVYGDNGQVQSRFFPYTASYRSGVTFALGDLDGNGTLEIVTGTRQGGGPHVRVFAANGRLLNGGFFAYATNFRGGVNVAVGDVNGDGRAEIITGAGVGGGPHVRMFDNNGRLMNDGFFAYNASFRGGVNVAAGDTDGDGDAEIITGAGPTGGPHVKIWNSQGRLQTEFFAFSARSSAGVFVAAMDTDGDRRTEIITLTTDFTLFNQ